MSAGLTKTYELPPWGADIRHVFTEMAAALDLRVLELSETAITVEGPDRRPRSGPEPASSNCIASALRSRPASVAR
jgi:hypothetical protein